MTHVGTKNCIEELFLIFKLNCEVTDANSEATYGGYQNNPSNNYSSCRES